MELGLQNRTAVVTGASRGIGAAVAVGLADEGVTVALVGRDPEALTEQASLIGRRGGRAVVTVADLSDQQVCAGVFAEIGDQLGGVDIVVHAAGAYPSGGILAAPLHAFTDLYQLNVLPLVAATQAFADGMAAAGFGRFVTVTDIAALMPLPGAAAYTASKAALLHVAVLLSKELVGTSITSNAVSPGLIRTPGSERMFGAIAQENNWPTEWPELEPLLLEHVVSVPAGRAGTPAEVARAVTFLASDAASYVNGAHLTVDGGALACIA